MIRTILMFAILLFTMPVLASDKLIQLIEYIGADYKEAVHNGEVVNAAEFAEMQEFASLISAQLPKDNAALQQQAAELQALVRAHADPAQVQQLTAAMRKAVIATMPALELPKQAPDINRGKVLYQSNCAVCHGMTAMGDGPAGLQLDPAPTNFHELERYRARSLFGLFNTISLGVEDTGMVSFSHLDAQSRWDLAFYVGAIAAEQVDVTVLDTALVNKNAISNLFTATPSDLEQAAPTQGAAQMALFRMQPERFFNAGEINPLQVAINQLSLTQQALEQKQFTLAYQYAVSAYLDGFELIENNLQAVAPELKNTIEQQMLQLRQQIKLQQISSADIEQIILRLQQAQRAMNETELAPVNVFLLALLILLREGLEALLVVAAIYSVAVKTEQPALKRSVHYGWLAALALGAVTWVVASFVINISGASRELTEGYTALIAAAILFYMGFWMHSKTSAVKWQQFIGQKVSKAMSSGAYLGLSLVVFLAVYREVFETILFYQSLWLQGGAAHQLSFVSGIAVALLALAALGVGLFKFALKLPLKVFFGSTALLMIALAVIMTGKGVAALQEAGMLSLHHMAAPTVSWLGIYPTAQGLMAQAMVLILAAILLIKARRSV